jgi:deoxyuridine 5'-triphosphate nucleotidohydrolase
MPKQIKIMSTPKIIVKKTDPRAVIPKKASATDIGYDLTIISKEELIIGQWSQRVTEPEVSLYDTGISVEPENGYYVEIVPRSSLIKSGYILANSVGIIDPSYRGSLKVALIKIDTNATEIPLPYRGFQLIVRKSENAEFVCTDGDLSQTSRGAGGFGSTNFARRNRPKMPETRSDPTGSAPPLQIQMNHQILEFNEDE